MIRQQGLIALTLALLIFLLLACGPKKITLSAEQHEALRTRTIDKPKDEVWGAVSDVLAEEKFTIAAASKEQGFIMTAPKAETPSAADIINPFNTYGNSTNIRVMLEEVSESSTKVTVTIQTTGQKATSTYVRAEGTGAGGKVTNKDISRAVRQGMGSATVSGDDAQAYDPFFDKLGDKLGVAIPHVLDDSE